MNKLIAILVLSLLASSCSIFSRGSSLSDSASSSLTKNAKRRYKLTDKSGEFVIYRENGLKKSNNTFVTKRQVLPFDDDKSKVLEQSIAISKLGSLGKKIKMLRPQKSQYAVWFDGKKYLTDMTLKEKERSMLVKLKSPEKQWNGARSYKFPDPKSVYCFFSQILECVAVTGFLNKAFKKGRGQFNFYVVWDGYPYFQEQYLNIPNSVFSKAKFSFDGKNRNGEKRFSLSFGGQVIFYFLDKKNQFIKKFWVSQGLSMVASDV